MPKKAMKNGNSQMLDVNTILHSLNLLKENRGLASKECAEEMGITPRHFSRLRKGQNVTLETLNGYAGLFGMEVRCQLYKAEKRR